MGQHGSLSVLAVAGLTAVTAQKPAACQFISGQGSAGYFPNITFSACPAYDPNTGYTVQDTIDYDTYNQQFYFNVGGDVPVPPAGCTGPYGAWQVQNASSNQACFGLTSSMSGTVIAVFDFIDYMNPARGFQVTLGHGDGRYCPNNRAITLVFECAPGLPFPAPGKQPSNALVLEQNTCQYDILTYSVLGCPLECPRVEGVVCGGTGVCGYDGELQSARCFCYGNWTGTDCQVPIPPTPTPTATWTTTPATTATPTTTASVSPAACAPQSDFPAGAVAGATIGGAAATLAVLLSVSYLRRG